MTSKIVVNNIESDSGISSVTFTSDIELGTKNLKGHNLESTGIVTAVSFTGSGANLTSIPAGNLTGTLPALDGSALTGVGVGTDGSINTSGIITATTLNYTGNQNLSHRNIIINGAMLVAQRSADVTSATAGYHTVDRIQSENVGADEAPRRQQVDVSSSSTPYTLGFRKAYKLTNGNQTGGAGAGDIMNIRYQIEAQDIATSGWNYTSASSFVTLQFWIKSSVSQNFNMYVRTRDGTNQTYAFDTGTLSADTWTKIIKTIPGNSNIQIDNDNGTGLQINFGPLWGTDRTDNSVTNNVWQAFSSAARMKDNATTWYTTDNATLELTGIQLEVGPVATPFEHRSFADELIRCQRYYEKSYNYGTTPGTAENSGSVMFLTNRSPGTAHTMLRYVVRKRSAPTLVSYSPTQSNTTGMRDLDNSTTYNYTMNRNGETGCTAYPTGNLGLGYFIQFHYTADAEL